MAAITVHTHERDSDQREALLTPQLKESTYTQGQNGLTFEKRCKGDKPALGEVRNNTKLINTLERATITSKHFPDSNPNQRRSFSDSSQHETIAMPSPLKSEKG